MLLLSRYEKLSVIFNLNIFLFLRVLKLFIKNRISDLIIPNPSIVFLCGQNDKMRDVKKTKLIETCVFLPGRIGITLKTYRKVLGGAKDGGSKRRRPPQ